MAAPQELYALTKDITLFNREQISPLPHSAEEYFTHLLHRGLQARKNGNYGIAAAYIVRKNGIEVVVFGENTLMTEQNPHGHAEMNAVQRAAALAKMTSSESVDYLHKEVRKGSILVHPAKGFPNETILVTTLEPCPMCTVGAVANSGVNRVLVGKEDPYSGQLAPERLANLAPIWSDIVRNQKTKVEFAQTKDPDQLQTYVPTRLLELLTRLFFEARKPLDDRLNEKGFLDPDAIGAAAVAYLRSA